jgi:hypothetical protein
MSHEELISLNIFQIQKSKNEKKFDE